MYPELSYVGIRTCAEPCSVKFSDCNWAVYDRIHNKLRNRLSTAKAARLTYLGSNLKLLRKKRTESERAEIGKARDTAVA